jgi:crotonobetainyl-CoA:carnitine CoA-transferase CaiB-like acyl-CoA transferase
MNLNQDIQGNPKRFPTAIVDQFTGLYLTNGILAALFKREQTGEGEKIAVNLYESGLSLLSNYNYGFLNNGIRPVLDINRHSSIVPYGVFKCKNNEFVLMGTATDKLFRDFCEIFEIDFIFTEFDNNVKRVLNKKKLDYIVESIFIQLDAEQIKEKLLKKNIPCSKVIDYRDALYSDISKEIGIVKEVIHQNKKFVYMKNPINFSTENEREFYISEKQGSDSINILKEYLNYNEQKIEELIQKKII